MPRHSSMIRLFALLLAPSCAFASSCAKLHAPAATSVGMFASSAADGSACRPGIPAPREHPRPVKDRAGMVWIPGGEFSMGSSNPKFSDTRPWHRVRLSGFWIDKTELTNDDFAKFVRATGYVTVAERRPKASDFPGVPREKLVAGSLVFTPPTHPVELNDDRQWWRYIKGANWRHPEGPGSDLRGRGHYPVVQIAFADAQAYARWAGKRLPTEAEFEYAERGGLDCKPYAWGDEFQPNGKDMANTFHGHFPDKSDGPHGRAGTMPVASYAANGFGLYDMSGNVWEWTSDWYRADYYAQLERAGQVAVNPKGPAKSYDPGEPGVKKHSVRGGSFLCTDQFCSRYEVGGRGETEPNSSANHIGVRFVL